MRKRCSVSAVVVYLALLFSSSAFAAEFAATLSLSAAVKEAQGKNPEITFLRERLKSMRARANQAPYLEDPEISLQTWAVPLSNPTNLSRADSNMIGIRQKFPFFGKLGLKEKISLQEAKMAEEELRSKEREIISKVKIPRFRNPFVSRAASKKPNWPSTMLRRMATKAITKRSVLTAIPRKGDAPGARLSGTGERFVRDRGSGHGQQTRELTVSHAYSPGRSFVPVRPPRA